MNPLKVMGLALELTVLAIVFGGFTGHSCGLGGVVAGMSVSTCDMVAMPTRVCSALA